MKKGTLELGKIQKLVGQVSEKNLQYVDCYVADHIGIFIPSVGFCEYAITPQHTHPSYSFILFFSENQDIVPVHIEVSEGHYFVTAISPGVPHEEKQDGTFTRYIAIMVSKEFYEAQYATYRSQPPRGYCWEQCSIQQDIMVYLKKFMAEYDNKLPGYETILESLGRMITHQLIRGILNVDVPSDFITDRFEIEKALEYMHQNYGEKQSVEKLAKVAHMSPSHFIRIFKKETGLAPMEYLIQMRIDKAKKLLRSKAKTITEISLQCGFNSASHFSSCFVKHQGVTPSEYQNSYAE